MDAGAPRNPLEPPPPPPAKPVLVLRDEHLAILAEVSDKAAPITAAALSGRSGTPCYELLLKYLKELEKMGLVARPHGTKSGYHIPTQGRAELKARGVT